MSWTCIDSKKVVTRKPHKCWGCCREFPKGSELLRVTGTDGGEIASVYWCKVCDAIFQEFGIGDTGVTEGEIRDGDPESWEADRKRIEEPTDA